MTDEEPEALLNQLLSYDGLNSNQFWKRQRRRQVMECEPIWQANSRLGHPFRGYWLAEAVGALYENSQLCSAGAWGVYG